MTPEKAIKTLGNMIMRLQPPMPPDELNALNQGIEALERCRHNYLNPQQADFRRLPSETEESKGVTVEDIKVTIDDYHCDKANEALTEE